MVYKEFYIRCLLKNVFLNSVYVICLLYRIMMLDYDCFRNVWQCAWIATWTPGILCLGHTVSDCKKKEVVYPRAIVNLDW